MLRKKPAPWPPLRVATGWTPNCIAECQQAIKMHSGTTAQIGDRVSFRIADVFLPEPLEVLESLTLEAETNGVVTEFSDSGGDSRAYAVVRITTEQSVLLPVSALHLLRAD